MTRKKKEPSGAILKEECSRVELAALFGIGEARINELRGTGIVVQTPGVRGKYRVQESLSNYIDDLRKKAAGRATADGASLADERVMTERVTRQIAELKLATMRGEVLTLKEVTEAWSAFAGAVRRKFLSLPGRIAGTIAHLTPEDNEIVRRLVRDDLRDLADEVEDRIVAGKPGDLTAGVK